MQFLISMHINPAVLDALTDEEKAPSADREGGGAAALTMRDVRLDLQQPPEQQKPGTIGWAVAETRKRQDQCEVGVAPEPDRGVPLELDRESEHGRVSVRAEVGYIDGQAVDSGHHRTANPAKSASMASFHRRSIDSCELPSQPAAS
jgi:hypothetical protein